MLSSCLDLWLFYKIESSSLPLWCQHKISIPSQMQSADRSIYWLVNSWKPKQLSIVSIHQFKSPPTHLLTNLSTHNLIPPQLTTSYPLNSPTQKNTNSKNKNNTNLSAHNLIKSQTQKISNSKLKLLSLILQKHSGFNSVLAKISAKK